MIGIGGCTQYLICGLYRVLTRATLVDSIVDRRYNHIQWALLSVVLSTAVRGLYVSLSWNRSVCDSPSQL